MVASDWVQCRAHGHGYPIEDGILRLLDPSTLVGESALEHEVRDRESERVDDDRAVETILTISAMSPLGGIMLELGCGNGHFTKRLAGCFDLVLAVDFSEQSLRMIRDASNVALVHADIRSFKVMPGAFDRVLSTLTSNLTSAPERAAMYELAADAVGTRGSVVFSADHHNLIGSQPKSGRSAGNGAYRYRFFRQELEREAARFFSRVEVQPMEVWFRGAGRLRKIIGAHVADGVLGRVPLVNWWAQLLLGHATA
jgi:SAM-dependent methyltransferase